MVMKSILKTLLTPAEKYLIKNQKQFALDSASSTSQSDSDLDTNAKTLYYQPYAQKLAQGVKMRKKSLMSSFGGSHLSKRRASIDKDDPFEDPDYGVGLQRKSRDEDNSMSLYRKRNDSYMRDIDKTHDDPNSRVEAHTD